MLSKNFILSRRSKLFLSIAAVPSLTTSQRFFFSSWRKEKPQQTPTPIPKTETPPKVVQQQQQQQQNIIDDDDPTSFLMNNNEPIHVEETNNSNNNKNENETTQQKHQQQQVPPPQLHAVGVDPTEQLSQPGSVRLEVQITVMTGKMNAFEKKLTDHSTHLAKIVAEIKILNMKKDDEKEKSRDKHENIEQKIQKLELEKIHSEKMTASSAAAWMSTALTLSSLLESEEGHRAEMKVILKQILDKLNNKKEFKASFQRAQQLPKNKKRGATEEEQEEDDDDDFFSSHEDSIRVATLVRLARVEHDLGNFEEASVASQKAIDEIIRCCSIMIEEQANEKPQKTSTVINLTLIRNPSIRYQWLLLCKLHATILAALNKTGQEQDFLKSAIFETSQKINEWKILSSASSSAKTSSSTTSNNSSNISITAIVQELNIFGELLMRYADSLGLEEGGGGWKKPQDPVFLEKRKVCEHLVKQFLPVLGKVHTVILQARACLALDCGSVAVSRSETISIMTSLITDAEQFLKEKEISESNDEEDAKKSGFNDVMGTTNEDLFALRTALLLWKRKLALAYADMKQFDLSLKLLQETSATSDQVLGISHQDSIITLRCLTRVTFVSGDEEGAKLLNEKLVSREKPASI